jgi:sugar O-acyltransferase (sialic acid O-acetyltransferase NeuD family)
VNFLLIGYSGHSFVVIESAASINLTAEGYFEKEEKKENPYKLEYLGSEDSLRTGGRFKGKNLFIGIGDNKIRKKIYQKLTGSKFINIVDSSANVSRTSKLSECVYVGKNASVNAQVTIGVGAIINTGAILEHECRIGEFTHVAPGAVLCGNVSVGDNSFIGANCVIRQGIKVGSNVIIGAGSVVVRDIPDNITVAGNPAREKTWGS